MPSNALRDAVTENDQATIVFDGEFLPASFRTQSYEIARDVVRYVCRGDDYQVPPSKMSLVMRNLVDDTLKSSSAKMTEMAEMLDITKREQLKILTSVADEMFEDQQVNWGRIVTLHAFCGCLAKYCERRSIPDCADDVGNLLADFVVNRLGLWIVTHGGWGAFERQIPIISWASGGMWKGVVVVALILGALFAFYTSIRFMSGPAV